MSTFGQSAVESVGRSIQVTADGRPLVKEAGVTIDWDTVVAHSGADITLEKGMVIKAGEKYLRYGQVITKITASGRFGPYDNDAGVTDGRQTLAAGTTFIINRTIREDEAASDHPPAIYGGLCWRARIRATTGTASLANGPTWATLLAVLPQLQPVESA